MPNEGDKLDYTAPLDEQEASGIVHSSPEELPQSPDIAVEDYEKNVAQVFKEPQNDQEASSDPDRIQGTEGQEEEKRDVESGTKTSQAFSFLPKAWPFTEEQTKWAALGVLTLIIIILFAIASVQRSKAGIGAGREDTVIDIPEDKEPLPISGFPPTTVSPIPPPEQRPVVDFAPGDRLMLGHVADVGGGIGLNMDSILGFLKTYAMPLMLFMPTITSFLGPQLSSLGMFNIFFVIGGVVGIYFLSTKWPKGPEEEGAMSYIRFLLTRLFWIVVGLGMLAMALTGVARMFPDGFFDKGLTLVQSYYPVVSTFFITLWKQRIVPIFVF